MPSRAAEDGEARPAQTSASSATAGEIAHAGRLSVLVVSFLWLWTIAFVVWLVTAGKAYREEYAQANDGWRIGTTREVTLTLVKEDQHSLACASDRVIDGLRCGYGSDRRAIDPASIGAKAILQPFNTTGSELLLGAGLWASADLKGKLPDRRFTAVCNYNIKGVVKSASLRWNTNGSFAPLDRTVTAGALTDCTIQP